MGDENTHFIFPPKFLLMNNSSVNIATITEALLLLLLFIGYNFTVLSEKAAI